MVDKIFELANAAHALELEGKNIAADEMRAAWARRMVNTLQVFNDMAPTKRKALFDALAPTSSSPLNKE